MNDADQVLIVDWVQNFAFPIMGTDVSYAVVPNDINDDLYIETRGRLPTEGRPNRHRRRGRFKVASDVAGHLVKSDLNERERIGKRLTASISRQLEGRYEAASDTVEPFEVDVDDHVLDR